MLDYFITPLARLHLDDAWNWYEKQEAGRGDAFIVEFHDRLREVRGYPDICCPVSKSARVAMMHRSNYKNYFRVKSIGVVVVGVRHFAADDDARLAERL